MLAMQMGFAARNAVQAHDMARMGITAPVQILGGRFGFYRNFEDGGAIEDALAQLGNPWKVTQLSHKPFPSGRVTHGVIHTVRQLAHEHGLDAGNALARIRAVRVALPPLGMRLVGRPMVHHPAPNYARLCIPYVAAAQMIFGDVDPTTFTPERLQDPAVETLARRVVTSEYPHPDPNAFYPQSLTLELEDGTRVQRDIPYAWGHPQMPLSRAEREDKFRLCWRLTRDTTPRGLARMEEAIAWLNRLPDVDDVRPLLALLAG